MPMMTRNSPFAVPLTDDLWEALKGADCAALVTRHREYNVLDLRRMKGVKGQRVKGEREPCPQLWN
jgi:hypothetical protein